MVEVIGARCVRAGIERWRRRVIRAMWDGPACTRKTVPARTARNGVGAGDARIQADEQGRPGCPGASLPDLLMAVRSYGPGNKLL